jgi:hypothetical protein
MKTKCLVAAVLAAFLFLVQASASSAASPAKPEDDNQQVSKSKKTDINLEDVLRRIEKMKEGNVLLRRILMGFPANCVTAQVVGTPKPVQIDPPDVTFRVRVKLEVDEAALRSFRKRLLLVLDEFKDDSWGESWRFDDAPRSAATQTGSAVTESEFALNQKEGQSRAVTDAVTIYVNTERDAAWKCLKWKAFLLDQMLAKVFEDAATGRGECVVSVVTKAGDTVPLDHFALDDQRLGGATPIADRPEYGNGGRTFFIAPTFLRDAACSRHAPAVIVVRDIKIPESLLDRVQALKCQMRFVSDDKSGK